MYVLLKKIVRSTEKKSAIWRTDDQHKHLPLDLWYSTAGKGGKEGLTHMPEGNADGIDSSKLLRPRSQRPVMVLPACTHKTALGLCLLS